MERRSTLIDITQVLKSAILVSTGTFYSLLFAMMIKNESLVLYMCFIRHLIQY